MPSAGPVPDALLGVDVGGTFTDAVLVRGDRVHTAKAPTTPDDQSRGVLEAIDGVLAAAGATADDVRSLAHGMTVATNALLEGRLARTTLCATAGFVDLVELGRQDRPHLYDLAQARPVPLSPPERRIAVAERCGPDGVEQALTEDEIERVVEAVAATEPEAVAVVLLHADRHPDHERRLGAALRERLGADVHVALSHVAVGTFREYERAATTEVDAAVSPLVGRYLRRLADRCADAGLPAPQVLQSSGGVCELEEAAERGATTVLSGPAGGAAAAAIVSRATGEPDLLCFDMGGTSCDVLVVRDGRVQEQGGGAIAGRPIALPTIDIHTVGAGGGSIAWADSGGALRVGPRSSGARPGPAAYGHGGLEPTVTDAHVVLGTLDPTQPLSGGVQLDVEAARAAVARLAGALGLDLLACAEGILRVADAEMLRALRVMTVERGVDPRGFALLAYGGAGGLHGAGLAARLGIRHVIVPHAGGVLSALGLAAAERRSDRARTVLLRGDAITAEALRPRDGGDGDGDGATSLAYDVRYAGQAFELTIRDCPPDPGALRRAFDDAHRARYGFADPDAELELVTIREATHGGAPAVGLGGSGDEAAAVGPAVLRLPGATVVVPAGWRAASDADGTLHLRALDAIPAPAPWEAAASAGSGADEELDAIDLQVLVGALRAACDEMGAVLVRSAHSANITERRDCSTALFDAGGRMIAQAEHIPVHLGAMPASVAAVRDQGGRDLVPGVSWILNDPFAGGSHLPDITVVTPVFVNRAGDDAEPVAGRDGADDGSPILVGFAAARAHHADVGGRTPGSMPADSVSLDEEGVLIEPQPLTPELIDELAARMRHPEQRRADLRAQQAACEAGARRLTALASDRTPAVLAAQVGAVLDYGERRMAAAIAALPSGEHRADDVLEGRDGPIALSAVVTVAGGTVTVDLRDAPQQGRHNLNCPRAVAESACLFAVRAAVGDAELPTDDGTRRRVVVRTRPGSLLDATPWPDGSRPAVVAGNVETSSRVADLVLAALGRALGQGTMNNVTLGDERRTMYETIGGGQGALPGADGPSAVHVAMSNTRNTPVEALETSFPVRVVRYEVRRGSGGAGAHRGGDGVVRELRALADLDFQLLTERRSTAPRGADGGDDGLPGRNLLDGRTLPAKVGGRLRAGQALRIETPGGGGHGAPPARG
ncbi:N-methylhydantoinase A [Patulibacter medicamentivorans]|uniref:N-methylhydantoinase A n=1 Tax=Patulibacter medicamentivorans TaxID=1097667 RepID=H0E5U6_9ACTN|nr:hydantoinase B/oxoprolinase family protein [Patulibacter medicamentivorans]EHN10928.1 N-methylhydantoinase A [Patulibacter medicamentivorans]